MVKTIKPDWPNTELQKCLEDEGLWEHIVSQEEIGKQTDHKSPEAFSSQISI